MTPSTAFRYTLLHPTLRGLGISVSTLNLAGGAVNILLPLIVLNRLHQREAVVGLLFAVSGVFGMGAAFFSGRLNTMGRERGLLVWPMVVFGLSLLLLLPSDGLLLPVLAMAISGLTSGPLDIALFTVRQRRTDPAWMGRAFAVSMAFNFVGYPIGAALAGSIASVSIDAAIVVGVAACLVAGLIAAILIPRHEAPFRAGVAMSPGNAVSPRANVVSTPANAGSPAEATESRDRA